MDYFHSNCKALFGTHVSRGFHEFLERHTRLNTVFLWFDRPWLGYGSYLWFSSIVKSYLYPRTSLGPQYPKAIFWTLYCDRSYSNEANDELFYIALSASPHLIPQFEFRVRVNLIYCSNEAIKLV